MVAPVIPGLTDEEMPAILEAAAEAGASHAAYIALRLPHGIKELFSGWLERCVPLRKERVLARVKAMRGGKLYNSDFSQRQTGVGPYALMIANSFKQFTQRFGLSTGSIPLSSAAFRPPNRQRSLF